MPNRGTRIVCATQWFNWIIPWFDEPERNLRQQKTLQKKFENIFGKFDLNLTLIPKSRAVLMKFSTSHFERGILSDVDFKLQIITFNHKDREKKIYSYGLIQGKQMLDLDWTISKLGPDFLLTSMEIKICASLLRHVGKEKKRGGKPSLLSRVLKLFKRKKQTRVNE